MGDVTALVLTIGEDTTQRAVDAVKRQMLPAEDVIVVKGITPFHKALNLGASSVKTEFFVQVDSDMVPDENCFEELRKCMTDGVGIAVGHLRDPLIGRVCGIKMFRKQCFETFRFKDSISPDTDFADDIFRRGWKRVYALRFDNGHDKNLWHTFGEHSPNYTPHYTYSKYLLEGKRYRYRKDSGGLRWHFGELQNSSHGASLIAQVAMAHGIFMEQEKDLLNPYSKNDDFDFLERFVTSSGSYDIRRLETLPFGKFNLKSAFTNYYKLGVDLRRADAFPAFKRCVDALNESRDVFSWVAKAGLCHGLFSSDYSEDRTEKEYGALNDLLT